MKDADQRTTSKGAQQSDSGKDVHSRAIKRRRDATIPGGAGAAGQIPIKGDDLKRKDDPLQPDMNDEVD